MNDLRVVAPARVDYSRAFAFLFCSCF